MHIASLHREYVPMLHDTQGFQLKPDEFLGQIIAAEAIVDLDLAQRPRSRRLHHRMRKIHGSMALTEPRMAENLVALS
jgi:hypothetical protein